MLSGKEFIDSLEFESVKDMLFRDFPRNGEEYTTSLPKTATEEKIRVEAARIAQLLIDDGGLIID